MSNSKGSPIWYELLTNDAEASAAFYSELLGWKVTRGEAPMHYHHIDAGQSHFGGMMQLTDQMRANGARPTWLFYLNVDDVDAILSSVQSEGGSVLMPAFDLKDVGRFGMVADPQGIPFYVMKPAGHGESTSFDRKGMGKCSWNELCTPDQPAANAFYAKLFGWTFGEKMSMPGGGDYAFVDVGGTRIGATMPQEPGEPKGWQFYFGAPDIDVAVERVRKAGGKIHSGPMDVPGDDKVIVASDPFGVRFGVSAPAK